MARTKKQAQPKWKREQAKNPQAQTQHNGDAMETDSTAPAEEIAQVATEHNDANEGGESDAPKKVSLGKLKKKQRWEQKQLKVKVTNLKKERLKLGKKNPEHKADRKALTKQMKAMLAEQQKAHTEEMQKGLSVA
ncbi:hypothetical protein KFL_000030770 [Klebsormidium nitens]|uniref:Uncharacterized protein n=1 Tax=Klebsormidium nitens TaxID=105231 RepID=A0A1Y1HH85_KLENI|nr:hypothetical protein KFL_000030770 [Klebsormidium nitens]|eukprot:GAQ77800.1 hypothetical protein KFL_000030770 [Klebsormidium nitens]